MSAPGSAQVDRYTALLRSAQQVFAAKGYAAASTEDIARTAGVSKSLVFRHFGSKAGLFASGVVQPLLEFLDEFSAEWSSPEWRESDLETITTRFVTVLYDRMVELRPMLTALLSVALQEIPAPEVSEFRLRLEEVFGRIAAEHDKACRRFGIVGLDSPLTVRITVGLVFAMAALDGWLPGTLSPRPGRNRVAAELSSFVTAAITLRPHRPPPFPQVTEPMANSSPQPRTGRRAWGSAPGELLAAAAELFSQKGYAATSTKEIAQRCGIAESLLFFHFPTKEDLFTRAVFEPFLHAVESLTGGWDRHAWQAHAIEQTTRTFIATLYHWMTADRALLLGMIHSSILTDAAGPSFAQAQTGLRLLFDRIETEHVKAREFHDLPPVDIPLTIRSTFAALLAVTVLDQLFLGTTPTPPTQDRVVAELLDYLTAATVRTIPPRSEQ